MKLSPEEIAAQLAEVRRAYIFSLEDKRATIASTRSMLCMQWDPDAYQSLYMILHSLAGSAETFGLANITRDARKLVDVFKQHANEHPISVEIFQHLHDDFEQLLADIKTALAELDNP